MIAKLKTGLKIGKEYFIHYNNVTKETTIDTVRHGATGGFIHSDPLSSKRNFGVK